MASRQRSANALTHMFLRSRMRSPVFGSRTADARLRRNEELPDGRLHLAMSALLLLVGVMALATVLLRP